MAGQPGWRTCQRCGAQKWGYPNTKWCGRACREAAAREKRSGAARIAELEDAARTADTSLDAVADVLRGIGAASRRGLDRRTVVAIIEAALQEIDVARKKLATVLGSDVEE